MGEQEKEVTQDIPAELEGVSEETAREIMAEVQTEDTAPEEPETETTTPTEEQPADAEADRDNKGSVPYKRFAEVNAKYRQMEEENRKMAEELAQVRESKKDATTEEPPANEPVGAGSVPVELLQQAHELAKQTVLQQMDLSAEDYEDLEYSDETRYKGIERAIQFQYNSICDNARAQAMRMQQERAAQQAALQTAYNDYVTYAEQEQQRGDFAAIWDYAANTRFAQLNPYEKATIQAAFDAVNGGKGTLEQVLLVRDYYDRSKAEFLQETPQKTGGKAQKMATAPRVDKVRGTPSKGGMNMAEISQMMASTPWEEIPEEIRTQLLRGRLT